jgi:branched-chain amino acid transport system substrate-binding protein
MRLRERVRRQTIVVGAISAVTGALLIGCHREAVPIVIGAVAPWHDQDFSLFGRRGIELAVAELNAAGGVKGRQVIVRWYDDGGTGAGAVAVAESLVVDKRVVAVIGHMNSTPMLAAVPVYDGHLTVISPWATSPELTGVSHWVFRNTTSDSVNGVTIADFAVSRLAAHRAVILYENDAYGRGVARAFRREFRGTVLASVPIPTAGLSYEPYVAFLKQQHPDVVMLAGLTHSAAAVLLEARHQQYATTFISNGDLSQLHPDSSVADGSYVPVAFSAVDARPSIQRFSTAFEARYHILPTEDAALSYDAARLLATAIDAVGSDRADVRRYLASLTAERPYPGLTGPEYFLSNGDPVGQRFQMGQMRHGTPVAIPTS